MAHRGVLLVLASGALVASVGLAGCSKNDSTSTSTSAGAGGAAVSTTTPSSSATSTTSGAGSSSTTKGSTTGSVATNTVNVVLGDTTGLNGPMTMTVAPDSAKAGKVTFVVKNSGTITHEMVVLQLTGNQTYNSLPVTDDKVSEDASKGETGDVEAGQTKTIELNLDAGKYALICNVEKHYAMGMRAAFTVT